jgi:lipopolysaccharide transport system permease protein
METAIADLPEIRIGATPRKIVPQLRELWDSRELTLMLARKEVRLRYRHSVAGVGWAVMQPLLTLLVLSAFQLFAGRKLNGGVPYALYAMTGLVPWTFFGHALTQCGNSIVRFDALVTKVYFPLLDLPISAVLAASADFVVAMPLVPALMVYYGYAPGLPLLLLPVFILHLVLFAGALGIWLALLNTKFRDTSNALPFVVQLWFFLTPIAYPASQVPARWQALIGINPMVGILEGLRWSLFGVAPARLPLWLACSSALTLILLVSGIVVFLRHEADLAESI